MNKIIIAAIIFMTSNLYSQIIRDFKKKNEKNQLERTQMLDLLRISVKNDIEQDLLFLIL